MSDALLTALHAFGLTYPGAHIKSPWEGHADLAVKDRTFAFLSAPGRPFSLTCKLPFTGPEAVELPYAAPAAYGLGRSGWVTVKPAPGQALSLPQLKDWIDESYRAVAPKSLLKALIARA